MKELEKHRNWLVRTARGIGNARNGAIGIDDIVQEGMIAMWQAMDSHDPRRGDRLMWMKANARWRMKSLVRKRISIREDADDLVKLAEELQQLQSLAPDSENAYHNPEIAAAIKQLTPRQREYVFRRFYLGEYESEMKDHFGYLPSGLWHSKANGARQKLEKSLAHLGKEMNGCKDGS